MPVLRRDRFDGLPVPEIHDQQHRGLLAVPVKEDPEGDSGLERTDGASDSNEGAGHPAVC